MTKRRINTATLLSSVSSAALACVGQHANAADMALKAPPVAAAPAYSWTGCYVGAQVGWGWGHQDVNETFGWATYGFIQGGNGFDSSGGLFGGQIGCNYQFSGNWVAGLQGFLAGSDINGRGDDPFNAIFHDNDTIGVKTDWLASITGRLGVTTDNNMDLWYVKGGIAWDHNQWDLHDAFVFTTNPELGESRTGWTVGAGVETVLWSPRWTGFAEFNYYGFPNGNTWVLEEGPPAQIFSTGKQNIETVTVGVNLKLGGP